jgi:hypothetical protein
MDSRNSLKEELRKEFLKNELSAEQLEALNSLKSKRSGWKYTLGFSTAAAIILFLFNFQSLKLEDKIAKEIAYNHLKNEKIIFSDKDLHILSKRLHKLNFKLVASSKFKDYEVLGAKYCSVQGEIAAQIKLKSPEGKISTLYQYKIEKSQQIEGMLTKDGVAVDLWKENGVNMGHAKTLKN